MNLPSSQLSFNNDQLDFIKRSLSLVTNMVGNFLIKISQLEIIQNQDILNSVQITLKQFKIVSELSINISKRTNNDNTSSAIASGKSFMTLINNLTTGILEVGKLKETLF